MHIINWNLQVILMLILTRQTRRLRDYELQHDRQLLKGMLKTWRDIKKLRETDNCINTSVKLSIRKWVLKYQICFGLKVLWNANACWLVLIYNTLIITNVAKRLFKYVPYILL